MIIPDINAYRDETPTVAYLAGTTMSDHVRILGQIDEEGICSFITVHVGDRLIGELSVD